MELTQLTCNGCGAALQIPENTRFITCRHCGASLEIKRNDSTIYSEVLSRIDQRTAEMAEDLGSLRREQEIERLDREWALQRESLLIRGKHGPIVPDATNGIFIIVIGVVVGIVWMSFAASMPHSGAFPLFGLLFIGVSIAGGLRSITAASNYQRAQEDYQRRRTRAISSIQQSDTITPPDVR